MVKMANLMCILLRFKNWEERVNIFKRMDLLSLAWVKVGLWGTNGRRKRDVGLLPLRSKLALVCKITWQGTVGNPLDMRVSVLQSPRAESCHQAVSAEEDIQTRVTLQSRNMSRRETACA